MLRSAPIRTTTEPANSDVIIAAVYTRITCTPTSDSLTPIPAAIAGAMAGTVNTCSVANVCTPVDKPSTANVRPREGSGDVVAESIDCGGVDKQEIPPQGSAPTHYEYVRPPVGLIVDPVMNRALSERRNAATDAMSDV